MVYIHKRVYDDLDLIFSGMFHWKKFELTLGFVENYIDDLLYKCYTIENEKFHFSSQYSEHKLYGKYIYRYHRNNFTLWYIIYDIDLQGNILVNKIISNHQTIK